MHAKSSTLHLNKVKQSHFICSVCSCFSGICSLFLQYLLIHQSCQNLVNFMTVNKTSHKLSNIILRYNALLNKDSNYHYCNISVSTLYMTSIHFCHISGTQGRNCNVISQINDYPMKTKFCYCMHECLLLQVSHLDIVVQLLTIRHSSQGMWHFYIYICI